MLQHVFEVEELQLVLGRVNLLIKVLKVGLNNKGRRIPSFRRGRMISTKPLALPSLESLLEYEPLQA